MRKICACFFSILIFVITATGYCASRRPCNDRVENVRDRRENIRDRREDVMDRRDDVYKSQTLRMLILQRDEAVRKGHIARVNKLNQEIKELKNQIERDKREDVFDKGENIADRVENVIDRHN